RDRTHRYSPAIVAAPNGWLEQDRHHHRTTFAMTHGLHHYGLGRGLSGKKVARARRWPSRAVDPEDGELIRELILDPSGDYQPHARSLPATCTQAREPLGSASMAAVRAPARSDTFPGEGADGGSGSRRTRALRRPQLARDDARVA